MRDRISPANYSQDVMYWDEAPLPRPAQLSRAFDGNAEIDSMVSALAVFRSTSADRAREDNARNLTGRTGGDGGFVTEEISHRPLYASRLGRHRCVLVRDAEHGHEQSRTNGPAIRDDLRAAARGALTLMDRNGGIVAVSAVVRSVWRAEAAPTQRGGNVLRSEENRPTPRRHRRRWCWSRCRSCSRRHRSCSSRRRSCWSHHR